MKINKKDLGKILIIIALLGGAYLLYSQYIVNPISHSFTSWEQSGSEVTTAKINEPVTLKLDIYPASVLGYKGTIKVQIKKDILGTSDAIVTTKSLNVNIPAGFSNKQTVKITFTPNEAAGGAFDKTREYFYKIYINNNPIYDPTESGDRNGLLVADKASSSGDPETGIPTVKGILFNDAPQITVAPGTPITTKVSLIGKGQGTLKVEIRKDVSLMADSSYVMLQEQITIDGSDIIEMQTWTAQAQSIGFRSYFARVWWNDNLIYDPVDPAQREFVKLSGSSTTTPTPPGGTATVSYNIIELKSASSSGLRINVPQNTVVQVYATVSASASATGTLSVEVKKDMVLISDQSLTTLSKQVNLNAGQNTVLVGQFTASDLTSGTFRQYFFKTYWNNDVINDPTDPNNREAVTTYSGGTTTPYPTPTETPYVYQPPPTEPPAQPGTLSITNVGFGANTGSVTVNKWQNVPVYVYASATGGDVYQQVRIEIRKDLIGASDTTYKEIYQVIKLRNGQSLWIIIGEFSPDESTSNLFGVRQYFARVSIGGNFVYDPTDPNNRNHVTVN